MYEKLFHNVVTVILHKAGTGFVTLGENQENFICLSISSDVLPRMAEQGFTSHGRLVECRSRPLYYSLAQAYIVFLIFGQRNKTVPALCKMKNALFVLLSLPPVYARMIPSVLEDADFEKLRTLAPCTSVERIIHWLTRIQVIEDSADA